MTTKQDKIVVSTKELIKLVAERAEVSQKDVKKVLTALSDVIYLYLTEYQDPKQEVRINIPKLGAVEIKYKEAREARNPQTGEKVQVPPRRVAKCKLHHNQIHVK